MISNLVKDMLLVFTVTTLLQASSIAEMRASGFGIYPGYGNAKGVKKYLEFERFLGIKMHWVSQNIGNRSWEDFTGSVWGIAIEENGMHNLSSRVRLSITVPLNTRENKTKTVKVNGFTADGAAQIKKDLKAVASGKHDEHYRKLANKLIKGGFGNAVIRLGHEADIKGYPYSTHYGNQKAYKKAFCHISRLFKKEFKGKAEFLIDYGVSDVSTMKDKKTGKTRIALGYPGDEKNCYVDIISVDIYDRRPWKKNQETLDYVLNFSKAKGKKMGIPEWGLCNPYESQFCKNTDNNKLRYGGDNPKFIENMYNWMNKQAVDGPGSIFYNSYFTGSAGENILAKISGTNTDVFPKSKAKFVELFGSLK